jgi:hypothetical protein
MSKEITNAEAVYAFMLWLNSRFDQITLSQHNSPEPGLELAKRFCEANNWAIPKDMVTVGNALEIPPRI